MKPAFPILSLCGAMILMQSSAQSQIRPPLYDEAAVPKYELPSVLLAPNESLVTDPTQWELQRTYLIDQLASYEYGFLPTDKVDIQRSLIEQGPMAGTRTTRSNILRKQIRVELQRGDTTVPIDLLIFTPQDAKGSVPCFVLLNFEGNQSVCDDPAIRITSSWRDRGTGVVDHHATEQSRGSEHIRFPIEAIVGRGYAVATAYYGDIDPDFDDGFENGVHALFPEFRCDEDHPDRWGSIGAWAWGLSRLADVIETEPSIDAKRLMVVGHSRLGKTALWAGANDPRFKIVYSNNSGCGGAALSKRCFGESVARINTSFPHWFCRNFRLFNDAEDALPIDQHALIAAIAPRRVYITSASEDLWADPLGELLGGVHASPAFELNGLPGLQASSLPEPGKVIGGAVAYHVREGKHELTEFDWVRFMDFAERP